MSTAIEVASNALVRIGANPISSFDEGGASGVVSANLYEITIRDLLSKSRWRFAAAKRQLARLTQVPLNEWSYAFQLPSDLILLYRAYDAGDYEVYEDKLYANQASVSIDYLMRPSEARFPPYFQLLCEYTLASEFALTVTSNRSLSEQYAEKALRQLIAARHADAQSRPNVPIQHFPYVDVRG